MKKDIVEKESQLWKDWQNCVSYFKDQDFYNNIEKCVNFYEGNHWGKISEKTKDLPRVTINMIEMTVNSKVAGILANPIKTTFYSDENPARAEELTRFNNYITKEMKFDEICSEVVEEGAVLGGKPVHFYWDADAIGKRGEYIGGVRAETLDILSIGVANPKELDIQKQKWVIIQSRQEVEAVKKLCKKEKRIEIVPDDEFEGSELDFNKEQDDSQFCTVLTKYYRINGEVYYEKATRTTLIHGPRPLNPKLVKLNKDEKIDDAVDNLSEPAENNNSSETEYKATLYPIAIYTYKKRKGCIFGRGEVEPIIVNNKAINFTLAMSCKSVEDIGFGQIVAKEQALGGQRISNDTSKLLIDKYKGAGYGFYSLNKQPFPAQVPNLVDSIMNATRSTTGTTEVVNTFHNIPPSTPANG